MHTDRLAAAHVDTYSELRAKLVKSCVTRNIMRFVEQPPTMCVKVRSVFVTQNISAWCLFSSAVPSCRRPPRPLAGWLAGWLVSSALVRFVESRGKVLRLRD